MRRNNLEPKARIQFTNPNKGNFTRNIMYAAALRLPNIERDSHKGQTVLICGSGPSMKKPEVIEEIKKYVAEGAVLVGCKAAIRALYDQGLQVEYGVSMDPGAHIANPDKIFKAPGCKHITASSSDPALFEYLKGEEVIIFHSATGLDIELYLYGALFKNPDCMGGGYNVVNRALSAMDYMGFSKIIMAGVDCGHRRDEEFYVNGATPSTKKVMMTDHGIIDGQEWMTAPDMLASGVALAREAKRYDEEGRGEDFIFIGDVLPKILREKDEEFLQEVIRQEKA